MPRFPIQSPPQDFGRDQEGLLEQTRKVAIALRQVISERPTGKKLADTPAQITADQDDYAQGETDVLRVSTDASRTINGFDYQGSRDFWLINVGSFNVVLADQAGTSEAQNRIELLSGNVTLTPNQSAHLWYDETTARWRMLGQ